MALGPPTLAGFQDFLLNTVGISVTVLPPASPVVSLSFDVSVETVNLQLQLIAPDIYTLCVYNLGASNIINWAQDIDPTIIYKNNMPFFAYFRDTWNIFSFSPGIIQSSADVSTSESMLIPDWVKEMTLADSQLIKDPYGRQYLAFAQKYGTLWGIT